MTRVPLLVRLLAWTFPRADREVVLGDLLEEWTARQADGGEWRWLGWQVMTSVPRNVVRRMRTGNRTESGQAARGANMRDVGRDVRHALRMMRRSPLFTGLLAVTLGLGIGANALIFSVVDGVILNPFPYPEPDRLVGIGPVFPRLNQDLSFWEVLSPAEYVDIAEGTTTLERVVAWDMGNRELAGEGPPERVFTAFWWGDAFETLEVRPVVGRGFLPEEFERGEAVAVLSHRIWQRLFGGDREIVGRTISVSGTPYVVVGVMPPETLIYGTDLWTPMPITPDQYARDRRQFQVLARMRPGVTMAQVENDLARLAGRIERDHGAEFAEYADWRLVPATWDDVNVRTLRPAGMMLMAAVGLVLLIACVNVAGMIVARSASRRRELAVRVALGAGGARIARQLLTETVVIATAGALLGLVLAFAGARVIAAALPTLGLPIPGGVEVSGRVLAFTAVLTLGVGILTGIAPTFGALRSDVQSVLRSETGATMARGRRRLQRGFLTVEVALAMVLLVTGGLVLNSFVRLQRADTGFETGNLLTMRLTLPPERYPGRADIFAFFTRLRDEVENLPGVRSAAVTSQLPGVLFAQRQFTVVGDPPVRDGALPSAYATVVGDGYFEALGLEPVRGRFPEPGEARPVAVINEMLARQYFAGRDPIGRRLNISGLEVEVVGVSPEIRNAGLERPPAAEMFAPMAAIGGGNQFYLMVRTDSDPRAVLPGIRERVRSLDPEQPIYGVTTAEDAYAAALASRRFATLALAVFAVVALVLAAAGIYALVSYAVSERRREIGVRTALGADRGRVRRLMVRQALLPVIAGGMFGLAGSMAMGRLISGLLYGVRATDPVTLVVVIALFGSVAALAAWLPALRATRLDPVRALRGD